MVASLFEYMKQPITVELGFLCAIVFFMGICLMLAFYYKEELGRAT